MERHQTVAGVERDLRRCLAAWETERRVDDSPLGEEDAPDRLLVVVEQRGYVAEHPCLR